MAIPIPPIDNRRFEDLRDQLLARIASHTPEWTHRNASDPGIALLELFAFLGESILYRANRIPERNRLAFLRLLGVPLHPGTPARAMVQFAFVDKNATAARTVPTGTPVQAGSIGFGLDRGLDVLPVTGLVCRKVRVEPTPEQEQAYRRYYAARIVDPDQPLALYQTRALDVDGIAFGAGSDAVDGLVWIALLATADPGPDLEVWRRQQRRALGERVLALGFVPEGRAPMRMLPIGGGAAPSARTGFRVDIAVTAGDGVGAWQWQPLQEFVGALERPGTVELMLPDGAQIADAQPREVLDEGVGEAPPNLADSKNRDRLLGWLRLVPVGKPDVVLRWIGINAVPCTQGDRVHDEPVGRGNGEPDQTGRLASRPLVPGSLRLWVGQDEWGVVDDVDAAPREGLEGSRCVQVDWQEGTLRFGNGLAGARPPAGAPLRVSYAVSAGAAGNVAAGAIQRLEHRQLKVNNPVAAAGGTDAEDPASAERHVARWLQHRDRCVTVDDFVALVQRTPGVKLARVEVLPAFHPDASSDRPGDAAGSVTILVLPKRSLDGVRPDPGDATLAAICEWLEPRRLVTTAVFLTGPTWVDIMVSVGIEVAPDRAATSVAEVCHAVRAAIAATLSPVPFGSASGWALRRSVRVAELMVVVAQVPGVRAVHGVLLGPPADGPVQEIQIVGLQLPWLLRVAVTEGDPRPLSELQPVANAPAVVTALPVPLLRDECR